MMLFEVNVRYDIVENGLVKKTTEACIIDALSFAEAEARAAAETAIVSAGEVEVMAVKRSNITEVVIPPAGFNDRSKFFKAKLNCITIDEKTAKEKKQTVYYLVNASDINDAHKVVTAHMHGSVMDYEIATLDETKIVEYYSHG